MAHLEGALEWLRPILLGSETWDYCVVWEISYTDISRSIKWVNCCCVAGSDGESCMSSPTREEKKGFLVSTSLCRDSFNPHPAKKKSCLSLAQFPFFMPLQSEIYGEVIVSSQPRWINLPDKLAPKAFHEPIGTRVLIPVIGGLVELFAAKQILENEEITEFVATQFNDFLKIDTIPSLSYKDDTFTKNRELILGGFRNSYTHYFQQSEFKPSMSDLLCGQLTKLNNHPRLEGLSSGSIPSGLGSGCPSENSSPKQRVTVHSSTKYNKDQYLLKQKLELSSYCDALATGKEISDVSHGEEKEQQFKSKNLIVERKRRARIKRGLCDLRSLVPKITKMNQAATLDDAIDHIVEMKTKVKDLQEELEELERPSESNGSVQFAAKLDTNRQDPGSNHNKIQEVQVEVNQLTMREFLIKILCKEKIGAFTRVLETLDYLGLQVTEVNVTSCKGISSNSFVVQVINGEIQAGELKDALIKHSCG